VTDSFSFVYAEHFQPERVLLGSVQARADVCDAALRLITLGEIDEAGALGAEDVHPKAQCLRLSPHHPRLITVT
jgi:hypothetical protein